jgi:hypothetical protein
MPAKRDLVEDLKHLNQTPDVIAMVSNAQDGRYRECDVHQLVRELEGLQGSVGAEDHGLTFMLKQAKLGAYQESAAVEDPDGFRRSPPDTEGEVPAARADDPPQLPARDGEKPADHADESTLSAESEAAQR